MAIAVVRKGQTAGTGAASEIATEGETATAGNLLLVGVNQKELTALKLSDDKGESGWTVLATKAEYAASANAVFIGWKKAAGGEKKIKAVGGTVQGLTYIEVEGLGTNPTLDSIVAHNNVASAKTHATEALTTAEATEIVFAAVGLAVASETITAWTGTGPLNNVITTTSRVIGGYLATAAKWTANTGTANWTKSTTSGSLICAFKAGSGATTFTEEVKMRAGAAIKPAEVAVFPTSQTIRAGANTKPAAVAVFPTSPTIRAGARTSPAAAKNVSVALSLRAGARIASQAALVAPVAVKVRAGAGVIVANRATYIVSTTIRAGARLVPAVSSPAPPGGKKTIVFIFEE